MFDVNKVRKDFPMIENNADIVYFDSSATSFKPQCVIDEVVDFYTRNTTNIHRGDYNISYNISKKYDDTRKVVKEFINANSEKEIVYTSGATASLNLVVNGYAKKFLKKGDVILTTQVEHASNILPWFVLAKEIGATIKYIPLNEDASFNIDKYKECFKDSDIKIVSLTYVSNVMGYIYPIKEICKIAHEHGCVVNVDGAQAVPHIKVDVKDLDIDFLSFSGHKMCGPDGIGILYGKYDLLESMNPQNYGGGSNARFENDGSIILKNAPEKFESGTPNIEGVLGLSKAIEYLNNIEMQNIEKHCEELTEYFMNKLKDLNNVEVYNSDSRTGIVTFNIKGIFAQDAAGYFNSQGISVRTGNHCAKILKNIIGVTDTIRASMYFYNTKEEIDRFIDVIKETTLEKCVETVL